MAPRPPKPERPLKPAVWWSVGINLVWALGCVLMVLVLGAALFAFMESLSGGGGDVALTGEETRWVAVALVGVFVVTALLGTGLTVGALVLLRLGVTFRTLPSFVQALLAALCAFAVSSVVGAVVGAVSDLASVSPALYGQ